MYYYLLLLAVNEIFKNHVQIVGLTGLLVFSLGIYIRVPEPILHGQSRRVHLYRLLYGELIIGEVYLLITCHNRSISHDVGYPPVSEIHPHPLRSNHPDIYIIATILGI